MSTQVLERRLWLLPTVLAFVALVFAVAGRAVPPIATAVVAIGCLTITAWSYASAEKHNDEDLRPVGVLFMVGSAALAVVSAAIPVEVIRTIIFAVASIMAAFGAIRIVAFRLGGRQTITERESAIAAAGLGVVFFVLLVQPEPEMNRFVPKVADNIFQAGVNATATAIIVFSMVFIAWLMSHDTIANSVPLALVSLGQAAATAFGVGLTLAGTALSWVSPFSLAGLALLTAAYVHPSISTVLAPTVVSTSELNVRRSLISFSVVLTGPVLLGINELAEGLEIQNFDLSLPTITLASSALSIAVALHLLGLVRRWAAVEHQGQHDPLTDLPNRPLFFSRLELTIESARLRDARFVVMFLDLDRFKAVNDTLGHEAGDELLRQVARRLDSASDRVGPALTVARLGGDEFGIIVPQVKDARHSHAVGRLFLDQFLEPFDVGLRDIYVTPSIGIAQFPTDGTSVEELIENADTAMFEAKERGRNTVVSYSPEQRVPGAHRLEIEAALHRAIEREELELYYQPQIDISTGKIFAVESLLRWVHPTLGRISPEKFVPVAEESTLIDQIGKWTIEEACTSAARWVEIGLPPINVAVNLSPRQFQKSVHLTDNVARALRSSGLPPERLELELTESLALEKPEEVNETLSRFREMGIRTAIDDFGVGHTGLDYLDRISVDTLKIDRSFINRIGESGAPLVTAVISLARGLNLDVIAEGVETRAQVNFLTSHGCRYMQGYLFSKPLTGPQLEQVLRNQMRREAEDAAKAGTAVDVLPEHGTPDLFAGEEAA